MVLVALLVITGSVVLIGRGGSSNEPLSSNRLTVVSDYSNNDTASVSWTQQGRLVGDDQHNSVRVTVTKSKRTVELLSGYAMRVEKSQEFTNNPQAFAEFTKALDHLSFGKERTVIVPDDRGVCPTGTKYIYRLTDNSKEIMRTWSDSCTKNNGPYAGGPAGARTIQKLFVGQITDYREFVSGVKF